MKCMSQMCRGYLLQKKDLTTNVSRFLNRMLGLKQKDQVCSLPMFVDWSTNLGTALPWHAKTAAGCCRSPALSCFLATFYGHLIILYYYIMPVPIASVHPNISPMFNAVLPARQEMLFGYFSATLDATIQAAKSRGNYDGGIVTLKLHSLTVKKKELVHKEPSSGTRPTSTCVRRDACGVE